MKKQKVNALCNGIRMRMRMRIQNEQTNEWWDWLTQHTTRTHACIHIKRSKVSHTYTERAHISWRASQRIRSITTIKFKTHTKWCEWRCEWRRRRRRRSRSRKMKERMSRVELKMLYKQPDQNSTGIMESERLNREKIKMKIRCSSVVVLQKEVDEKAHMQEMFICVKQFAMWLTHCAMH